MSRPSCLGFLEEGGNAVDVGPFQNLCVGYLVLPPDVQKSAETAQVKMVQLAGMSPVHGPCFTGVEEDSEHNSSIHLLLGGKAESSTLPYIVPQSSKCSNGFSNSIIDFCVNICCSGEGAAKVGEVVNRLQVLPFH